MGKQPAGYRTFGELIDAYQADVYRYLWRLTGDPSAADDLFQETFLRALPAFDRLRPGSNHRAWVYRIATNTFLNHRRRARRRREVALMSEPASPEPTLDDGLDGRTAMALCRRAILRLPARQRAAFVQRNVYRLSYVDIARALACTEAAARANVYQATKRLRRELLRVDPGGDR